MKIIYITSDWLFETGGISQHIENLTKFMAKSNDVYIIYLNHNNENKYEVDSYNRKIHFISNGGSQLQRLSNFPLNKIDEIIKKIDPDIIHVHTLFDTFRLRKYSQKMVFTNHSSSYLKMHNNWILKTFILPKILKKFDLIISPSTELFEKTLHFNSIMIPNGVDTNRFNNENRIKISKKDILSKYNVNYSDQKIFISTRRLVDKNGVLEFIRNNISFFKKNKNSLYLIAGTGEHFNEIKKIKEDNALNNIYLLGNLKNSEIDSLYYVSDFCLIPSKMEAISISALEAMASGSIVIANKVGGLAELIQDRENGVFLQDWSLEKTFDEGINTTEIVNNAYKIVKDTYSWDIILQKTIEAYKKLN